MQNKVSGTKVGHKNGITPDDPRYYIMEPVVTNEMAEVALCMDFRKPKSAAELAKLCCKNEADTAKLAFALAKAGVCFVNTIDGADKYWYDTWVPRYYGNDGQQQGKCCEVSPDWTGF